MTSTTRKSFKSTYDFDARMMESSRVRKRYSDRVPIICERANHDSTVPRIDKSKYLTPHDLTIGQFVYVVRKRIQLPPEKALFIMINGKLLPTCSIMSQVYEEHKDEDGFLYATYSGENTFG